MTRTIRTFPRASFTLGRPVGHANQHVFYKLFTEFLTLGSKREPLFNYIMRTWRVTPALP
jgi:hypothetical protein